MEYVVGIDNMLSGWGMAKGGLSYFAIACRDKWESDIVSRNMRASGSFRRVRVVSELPEIRPPHHLSVKDFDECNAYNKEDA